MDNVDRVIQVMVALGGIAGVISLLTVRATKKKIIAESGKTDAEAEIALADAHAKRVQSDINLIEPYERMHVRMQAEIDEQAEKIDRLTDYVEVLVALLRVQGVVIPPMPKKGEK